MLLQKLEESVSEQTAVDEGVSEDDSRANRSNMEDTSSERQPQTDLDEEQIREFLSAKNLKSVRNDSSKRSSGCFGRRMDRIGSMSSLGCNTIGRYSEFHCRKPQEHTVPRSHRVRFCLWIWFWTWICFLLLSRSKAKMKSYRPTDAAPKSVPKPVSF